MLTLQRPRKKEAKVANSNRKDSNSNLKRKVERMTKMTRVRRAAKAKVERDNSNNSSRSRSPFLVVRRARSRR